AGWHLAALGRLARRRGADAVLLPAANRRLSLGGPPTLAVVHDLAELHVRGKYHALRTPYVEHVVPRALRRAAAVVAVSGATRDDLVRHAGLAATAVRVVPNGVDVERFRPGRAPAALRAELRQALGFRGPFVYYPARLELPGKNHLRLLEAFARAARAGALPHHLVLTGSDWGAWARIDARARELGVRERLAWLGRVDAAWVPALVQEADAIAMPGLFEGFGLPALEGLACGTPVACSDTGALPEVVGELGVRFDPRSPEDMARALATALTHPVVRRRAAEEGPAWAARRSWCRTAARLDALLEEIAVAPGKAVAA
ncbi:MAG TPA: glycosyltransferase family 1 protein, partial [Polyangiaceae bacterium LLY-WYZ-15_(1-7)]|nr:glycosyltransferase family 1 protein [Polyangiaceae bacterium LLY-WYZ-15_(1-7)]